MQTLKILAKNLNVLQRLDLKMHPQNARQNITHKIFLSYLSYVILDKGYVNCYFNLILTTK